MVDIRKEEKWRELLEKDEEICDLANKSGLTENPERVYVLWLAMESGKKNSPKHVGGCTRYLLVLPL